jgi:hypothetical protein
MLVSFLELTVTPASPRIRLDLPATYEAVAETPPGILAEYPLIQNVDWLVWQREHRRPVVSSEAFGTSADDARRMVVDPAAPGTAETLSLLGVTAIVTRANALDFNLDVPDVSSETWGPGYELVERTPAAAVWRLVAPAAPALVTLVGGFSGPYSLEPGRVAYPFVSPSGVGTIGFVARAPSAVRLVFDTETPKGQTRVLRLGDAETELPVRLSGRVRVSVLVEVPRGRSFILVKTDPAAESEEDAIVFSTPRATTSAEEPVLHATLESDDPGF